MYFECNLKRDRHDRGRRCSSEDEDRKSRKENRCGKPDCHGKCGYAIVDGMKYYAPYCHDHACMVGPQKCRRMKSRDDIYCSIHATCTADGCFATPDRLSTKPLPWFCDTHKCVYPSCVSYGCYGGYCSTHISLCAVGGCPGQRCQNSPFCEFHGDRARNPAADSSGGGGGAGPSQQQEQMHPPAGVHQCDMNCTEHRHSNKVYRPDSFCRTPGCNRLRQIKDGGESEWCENHTCESYMCVRKRSDRQPSMKTCERHSCAVDRCDLAARNHSAFCRRHGCEADNCTQYKDAQVWYCSQHECQRTRCGSKAFPGTDHCPRHLEEQQQQQQQQQQQPQPQKDKKEKEEGKDGDGDCGDRDCRWRRRNERDAPPPVVIVTDNGRASDPVYWSEPQSPVVVYLCEGRRKLQDPPSPVWRRRREGGGGGGERVQVLYYPDCVDDARAGRIYRGC